MKVAVCVKDPTIPLSFLFPILSDFFCVIPPYLVSNERHAILESLSSKSNSDASVTVADNISVNCEDAILKGHGTAELDGHVVATLCGVVERVNKLVYVRALRARYKPEIGDIIVGRIIEVKSRIL
ncbi:exosome complex component RRP4 homolog [Olea europaea subsp. europaea]|uniref:Exosome complex component RRP4 homolog n=1 Tax=Olea europaea subsp. europaea TaxID=158383 RepID=A0A8S0UGU5_OLEEU|nr:exosome complex component RRP4 homolog [Olea europaea subsp. europaea]